MQNHIEKWRYNNTSCMGANCCANPDRYTAHNKRTLTISIILTTVFEHGVYKYFSSCQYFCVRCRNLYAKCPISNFSTQKNCNFKIT